MKPALMMACLLMSPALLQGADTTRSTHPAHGVTRVVIETPGELQILPGKDEQLLVDAEPKVQQKLDIVVKDGTLYLRSKGSFKTDKGLRYQLTIPQLHALLSRGSANASVGAFRGQDLSVEMAGSGEVALENVQAPRLQLEVSGSGSIHARGQGQSLRAELSGSGEILAEDYAVARAEAHIGGSGDIRVRASERLQAGIDGSGNIQYAGKPAVTQSISGAGSVDPL